MPDTVEQSYQNAINLIDEMTDGIDQLTLAEQIEIAAALHALTSRIGTRINPVKESLREAIGAEDMVIGTKHYDGTVNGRATVTLVDVGYSLSKKADVPLLKTVLGDEFDTLFEEVVSYNVRKTAPDKIAKIASEDRRDLIMKHVNRKESAPRVAFTRK